MKRLYILLTVLLCCVLLASCAQRHTGTAGMADPIRFYYCRPETEDPKDYEVDTGAIGYEYRDLGEHRPSVEDILATYMQGPVTEELRSPFPSSLSVDSAKVEQGVLTIMFNDALAELSGMKLTSAAACLVHTMTQLDGIEFVQIQTAQPLLSGLLSIPLDVDSFVLTDDYMTSDRITVKLYFPVKEGKYLREENRSSSALEDRELSTFVLRQLMDGSKSAVAEPAFPEGTELLDVQIAEGVCTVDLSDAFLKNAPADGLAARLQLMSVVNTLTNLEGIDRVAFLCEGESVTTYGPLQLSDFMTGEASAVETTQPSQVQPTSLYLPSGENGKLAEIPVYVRKSAGRQLEADVLSALLSYESKNGYVNVIPQGTSIVEIKLAYRTCRLTLSSNFADLDDNPEKMLQAVRAVVASLCALDTIETVQLKIVDRDITSVDLSRILTPNSEWFVS